MAQIDRDKLLKKMKELVYVSTESGPVVPSKTKVIKMLTKQIPDPVSKPQDGDDWDTREYKQNKPLVYGKNLITTRDLYKKVFTEAVTNTQYKGMRLNLASIDMKETHCKFIINRRGHDMLVEFLYPNDNGNITVKLLSDTSLSNLYEVPLESPQFTKNFGYTILKTCDQLIDSNNTYDVGNDLDTMQTLTGLGNGTEDPSNSWMATDSAVYHESVGSELSQLLNLCNAVNLLEDAEMGQDETADPNAQDPNAAAFAMPGEGEVNPDDMAMQAGDVNGTSNDPNANKDVNFREALLGKQGDLNILNPDGTNVTGSESALDLLSRMVSDKIAQNSDPKVSGNSTIQLSGSEIYNGTVGVKEMNAASVINAFFDNWSSLDKQVNSDHVQDFINYLKNPGSDNVTLAEFEVKLGELFPECYNGQQSGQMSTDGGLDVPSEDKFNGEGGAGGDFGGGGGDMFGGAGGDFGGGDIGGGGDMGGDLGGEAAPEGGEPSFMQDGSVEDMMDTAQGGGEVAPPSDEGSESMPDEDIPELPM